jgi:branched-chain amino acid transport system ATP-binding protein
MMLQVEKMDAYHGSSHVLQGLSLSVAEGETVALLGRNGVGKTTTLRAVMGLVPPRRGSVRFGGQEIAGQPPDAIARRGLAYVPDDHRIFPTLTVNENLEVARRLSGRRGYWDRGRVMELFPGLVELATARGVTLSGGEKKMLGIGRALMSNPRLILLDEPSEGLAPLVVAHLVEVLGHIGKQGATILLADQNLRFCRRVCDRGYVLEKGRVQFDGGMDEISRNEEVIAKYLVV